MKPMYLRKKNSRMLQPYYQNKIFSMSLQKIVRFSSSSEDNRHTCKCFFSLGKRIEQGYGSKFDFGTQKKHNCCLTQSEIVLQQ